MNDLSYKTARELLTEYVWSGSIDDYATDNRSSVESDVKRAERIDACISRDERLTRKLSEIDEWRDKWVHDFPLKAITELDSITGDAP